MQPRRHRPGFWALLSPEEQQVLYASAVDREYPPGAALCTEGDPATHVFILLEGWVKVRLGHRGRPPSTSAGCAVRPTWSARWPARRPGSATPPIQAVVAVQALTVSYDRFSAFLDSYQGGSRAYRGVLACRWLDAETTLQPPRGDQRRPAARRAAPRPGRPAAAAARRA